jgi:hypothetical protein
MTDEHEHAMKVAEQAYSAGNLVTCDGYYEFDLDAAAAVIAADRAGLVARIAELEGALFDATAMIGHNLTMKATALVAGKTLNAYDVWKAGSAALKDTRHDEQ